MKVTIIDPDLNQFSGNSFEELGQKLIQREIEVSGTMYDENDFPAYMARCNERFAELLVLYGDQFAELGPELTAPARTDSMNHYLSDMVAKGFFTCMMVLAEPPFAPALAVSFEAVI